MILIIDGYNVIHRAAIFLSQPLEKQREELIRLAANHSQRKKGTKVLIFFDNRSNAEFWDRPEHPFVKVIFASEESADDAILSWISSFQETHQIEVATDDKPLRDKSKHLGANWISVEELMHRFQPESTKKPAASSRKSGHSEKLNGEKPDYYESQQINRTLPWGK